MRLHCPALDRDDRLSAETARRSGNRSPPLGWDDVPVHTKTLAVVCVDPDAAGFVHWLAWNIPADWRRLDGGVDSNDDRVVQGRNGFGEIGWTGPEPPPNERHRYVFQLYALDTRLDLLAGASLEEFRAMIAGHATGRDELVAYYDGLERRETVGPPA